MQMFIRSVLSALETLLKGPTWLLRKVISIFFGRREPSPPPPILPSAHSLSDSLYENAHSQHQRSYERTRSQQQRSSTSHTYSPPCPAAEFSQSPSAHQSPLQHTPYQPHRQPSAQFPVQPTPPVSPDVAPVTEPVRSHIPQRSHHFSGPELATRAPEVVVTPIVIDPHEDPESLRLKARNEWDRMEECLKQSRKAFARNERGLATQLFLGGEVYKDNIERLNKEASRKIFQEYNQRYIGSNTIDLHELFVVEAKEYFDDAVQAVRNRGESLLYVIVGRGNHSVNNIAKIRPAIQEYGKSLGLGVEVDPLNDGCLVVSLNPS